MPLDESKNWKLMEIKGHVRSYDVKVCKHEMSESKDLLLITMFNDVDQCLTCFTAAGNTSALTWSRRSWIPGLEVGTRAPGVWRSMWLKYSEMFTQATTSIIYSLEAVLTIVRRNFTHPFFFPCVYLQLFQCQVNMYTFDTRTDVTPPIRILILFKDGPP